MHKPRQSFAQFIELAARGYANVEAPPVVRVRNAVEAISFYCAALGARIVARQHSAGGPVEYGELQLGSLTIAVDSREIGAAVARGGTTLAPGSVVELTVLNLPASVARALRFGAMLQRQRVDQQRRLRAAALTDRYGVRWLLTERETKR